MQTDEFDQPVQFEDDPGNHYDDYDDYGDDYDDDDYYGDGDAFQAGYEAGWSARLDIRHLIRRKRGQILRWWSNKYGRCPDCHKHWRDCQCIPF